MKYFSCLFLAFMVSVCMLYTSCHSGAVKISREQLNLTDWLFHQDSIRGADSLRYSDASWARIIVPHDWSVEKPFSAVAQNKWNNGGLQAGFAWYRKHFVYNRAWDNKEVDLVFEGVNRSSKVWVNGHLIGSNTLGNLQLRYCITKYLRKNNNVIAVLIDHNARRSDGLFDGSGINRPVYLDIYNKQHFIPLELQVRAENITENEADLRVDFSITNKDSSAAAKVRVKHELLDSQGKIIGSLDEEMLLKKRETIRQIGSTKLVNIKLWSPEQPNMYHLVSTLYVGSTLVDKITTAVGIRSIKQEGRGVSINREHVHLKAVKLYESAGCLGTCIPNEILLQRLQQLKNMGCNTLLTLNHPFSSYFYNVCDSLGFLVFTELIDKNAYPNDYLNYFNQSSKKDIETLIKSNANHPSIIGWVLDSIAPQTDLESENKIEHEVKKWDSTRIATPRFGFTFGDYFEMQAYDYASSKTSSERLITNGIIDVCGFPKEKYYELQCQWSNIPMVYVQPLWNFNKDSVKQVTIKTYSNDESVQLLVNNNSMGIKPNKKIMLWKIPYTPGSLQIIGTRSSSDELDSMTCYTPDRASQIKFKVISRPVELKKGSVITVEAYIADKWGHPIYDINAPVSYIVKGSARIIGIDNGNPKDITAYTDRKRNVYQGRSLIIIRMSEDESSIHLIGLSDNIIEGHLIINSHPQPKETNFKHQ